MRSKYLIFSQVCFYILVFLLNGNNSIFLYNSTILSIKNRMFQCIQLSVHLISMQISFETFLNTFQTGLVIIRIFLTRYKMLPWPNLKLSGRMSTTIDGKSGHIKWKSTVHFVTRLILNRKMEG